jgi:glycosyltransferase involved in cell wall biosynthesis
MIPTTPVLVSVVIPAHNAGPFIGEAVTSVLAQGVDDLEVIVIDDASADNTAQVVGELSDPRVRLVLSPKIGVGAARNRGMELARGQFIGFLDADDRWLPGKLDRQLALLESEPEIGFVFTNFRRFDATGLHEQTQFDYSPQLSGVRTRTSQAGGGRVITDDTFNALVGMTQLPCWVQTMLARTEVVRPLSFPPDMRLSQDLVFILNVYDRTRGAFLEDPLVEVRRHAGNSYRRGDEKIQPDLDALTRTLAGLTSEAHRQALRRRLGRAWLNAGYHYLWTGQSRAAADAYAHALTYPGARTAALVRLAATPLAPVLARRRREDLTAAFPSHRG